MDLDLKEGDAVTLPCRRCASLAIRLVIRKGTTTVQCTKCGGDAWFQITEGPLGRLQLKSSGGRETPVPR